MPPLILIGSLCIVNCISASLGYILDDSPPTKIWYSLLFPSFCYLNQFNRHLCCFHFYQYMYHLNGLNPIKPLYNPYFSNDFPYEISHFPMLSPCFSQGLPSMDSPPRRPPVASHGSARWICSRSKARRPSGFAAAAGSSTYRNGLEDLGPMGYP